MQRLRVLDLSVEESNKGLLNGTLPDNFGGLEEQQVR
jgi:hypothetical protein